MKQIFKGIKTLQDEVLKIDGVEIHPIKVCELHNLSADFEIVKDDKSKEVLSVETNCTCVEIELSYGTIKSEPV